ncbi:hypothetical protein KSS87_006467 [Heliosperma pusillum]|nr:hypothetical protein KSS87_006467 [Heliosperma pusillum]
MFLKHDLAFSSRKVPVARKVIGHDKFSMIWLPVCPKWRTLRKVATIQLFSKFRLDSSQVLREMKVNELVDYTRNCWKNGVPVDIGKAGFTTLLNMMSNTLFSTDLGSHDYRSSSEEFKDIVWHLLEEGSKLNDLFLAGSDTTFNTLEWAMTELLHNPEKMTRAQNEIDQVLGSNNGLIQESDISNLPYIQAVIKETLRLHPPAPILVPHRAQTDVELCGHYFVPKGTEVWVNVWSMGRDPTLWKYPKLFLPERFIEGNNNNNNEIDLKHQDFRFIPFGAGRRMCPGMSLAYRMMHLMLANLIYSFNWKYENGFSVDNIDGQETFGLSMQRVDPLLLIPIPRQ